MDSFIGDNEVCIATFLRIKLCISEASSHRTYTNTLSAGDSEISVNIRQSHELKPSQAFYQ